MSRQAIRDSSFSQFGQLLHEARLKAGLSQKEVADELGYGTAQVVSDWERGVRTPPGVALKKLLKLYSIPIEEIYDVLLQTQVAVLDDKLRRNLGIKG